MAQNTRFFLTVGIGDSEGKTSPVQLRVSAADGQAWLEAANWAARRASAVGLLAARIVGLSAGNLMYEEVTIRDVDDTVAFPDPNDNIYNFDKLSVGYKAGIDHYSVTIPARDDTAYTVGTDGVTLLLTAPAGVVDFITSFEAVVLAKNGGTPDVEKMLVAS